ncbi:uncharacterized protein CXorf65 homolog isoform X1 [Saccostrea echinata]|uniref:uncharacterized protein CXorf65 homolog isoform X1 n=1 Tax=Saccostrea echinata TaxID=191078 RepID=UPI002A7F07F1|nr:uncharacterized protein CXorf65 homolog isoform X1 [Saccostrea echinata]
MTFIIVEHGENENLIVNPDCSCKHFLDYIRTKCKISPKDVVDLIDENAWASELFTKNPSENVVSMFAPRGVYILASIELYEDNSIKKITPLLQDWEKKYQFLERKLKHWDKKQQKIAEEKAGDVAEIMSQINSKEIKDGKLNRKKSERTPSASNRKDAKSPDVNSTPKKSKKKRKVST